MEVGVTDAGAGGMAEWLMAAVLKTVVPERVSGVRIPLPPPTFRWRLPNESTSYGWQATRRLSTEIMSPAVQIYTRVQF